MTMLRTLDQNNQAGVSTASPVCRFIEGENLSIETMIRKQKFLFISANNNYAAQMAEHYLHGMGGDLFEVRSAYINDACQNASALFVLIEDGLAYEQSRTRKLNTADLEWADQIVVIGNLESFEVPEQTMCKKIMHWNLDTTDTSDASQEEELGIARANRDTIKLNVNGMLSRIMV